MPLRLTGIINRTNMQVSLMVSVEYTFSNYLLSLKGAEIMQGKEQKSSIILFSSDADRTIVLFW